MDDQSGSRSGEDIIAALRDVADLPTQAEQVVALAELNLENFDFCTALLCFSPANVVALIKAQADNLRKRSGKPLSFHEKELAEGYRAAQASANIWQQNQDAAAQADLAAAMLRQDMTFIKDPMGTVYARSKKLTYCVEVTSGEFHDFTLAAYEARYGKIPQLSSVKNAIAVIAAVARQHAPTEPVWLRVGGDANGEVWIDLCNADHEFVKLSADGWEIQTHCPLNFRRVPSMQPLPRPVRDVSPDEGLALLRKHLNMGEHDLIKVVAFATEAYLPGRQYPILAVQGQADSAKSTACKVARMLVDPNSILLRGMPKSEDDLVIAARRNWVNAFDNVSGIPIALSDALCRVSTGGGLGKRKLYSDDEEKIFEDTRPIALNGLSDLANRHDLLTRTFSIVLQSIKDKVTESQFWTSFKQDHGRILGFFLNFLVHSLRQSALLDEAARSAATKLHRISDCSVRMVAGENYAWPPGTWAAAMADNELMAKVEVLDDSVIYFPLCAVMKRAPNWRGTAHKLLQELELELDRSQRRKSPQRWPANARGLSIQLRAIIPALAKHGINVVMRESHGERLIEWNLDESALKGLPDVLF